MVTGRKGGGAQSRAKGVKYMVMEDLTLGGNYTMQYTDDMLSNCTPETYIILLTDIAPISLI